MSFDFEIVHKPGAYNIADYLSRHPIIENSILDDEDTTERHVYFVSNHAIPKSMTRDEIVDATKKDIVLGELRRMIRGKTAKDPTELSKGIAAEFGRVFEELSFTDDGLIMRGDRLILPETLHMRALKIAHEGHQGITKTKGLLRTKIWYQRWIVWLRN